MNKKVAIIGTGFAGLSAAAKLGKAGFDVTVFEKNDRPGGRAMVIEEKGFKFDMGPTWYMLPDIFEKFFDELDESIDNYYKLIRLDPSYKVYFDQNNSLEISPELKKNLEMFDSLEKNGGQKLKNYLANSKKKYETGMKYYVYRRYDSFFDFFDWKLITEGLKLNLFTSLDSFIRKYFKNENLIKLLEFMVVFLGGSPKNVPALYSLLAHADFNLGIWYPAGGINSVVSAFESLCKKYNVNFEYSSEVAAIDILGEKKQLKFHDREPFDTNILVNTSDYAHFETELLPQKFRSYPRKYWKKKVWAPSALMFYLGINKKVKNLRHHTLFMNNDWEGHFKSIFDRPSWPESPLYYLCAPTKTDRSIAPAGHEIIIALIPLAPGLRDTEEIRKKYFTFIINDLENVLGDTLKNNIVYTKSICINDYRNIFNAYMGNAFGLAHTLRQTTVFRPKYKSKKVEGLYYVGHCTIPGIGMGMATISGQLIADLIIGQK